MADWSPNYSRQQAGANMLGRYVIRGFKSPTLHIMNALYAARAAYRLCVKADLFGPENDFRRSHSVYATNVYDLHVGTTWERWQTAHTRLTPLGLVSPRSNLKAFYCQTHLHVLGFFYLFFWSV